MATVALISSYTPSLVGFRGPLVRALRDAGHRVVAFGVEEHAPTERALRDLGAELRLWKLRRAGLNPVLDLGSLADLTRQLRAVRPDVVISYTMKPVVYGSFAARLAGARRIYSLITGQGYAFIGSDRKARFAGAVLARLLRAAFRYNDRVLVYNEDIERTFRGRRLFRSPDQCVHIHGTGVDLDAFAAAPPVEEPVTFLLIARLLADKGIREYAEAARQLKARWPAARFVLVGPYDPNPTGLRPEEVQEWMRQGFLEYPGATADVRPFLREASVYVLPSYAEGIPRTVLEAMAMARPVVTTDAPGCRDTVLPGETGLLVPPRDAGALAAAMEHFLTHPDRIGPMGLAGRRLAEERYDVHRINARILEITGLSDAPGAAP